jgi:hypothetical protein
VAISVWHRYYRFWDKVQDRPKGEGCWLWEGAINSQGYGNFWDGVRFVKAHRFAYECLIGEIPEGLTIDHLCRVRHCVNPSHLEPVTMRENFLRGDRPKMKKLKVK